MESSTALPKPSARREAVLIIVLSVIAVIGLVIVFSLVTRFRDWRSALADRTYRHGLNEMQFGKPTQAVDYFRSALAWQPDNFDYQFSLAQALQTAGRFDEAEAYFRNLWEKQPQNGNVNLQLGRLAAHRGQTTDVLRYYHNAIYGIWKSDPDENRHMARVELVEYLAGKNDVTQAQSELIAMQAGLPPDPNMHLEVASLFMRIQDYEHAFGEFRQVRQLDRKNVQAAAGAGIAAFHLGHFRTAQHYLEVALYGGDRDQVVRNLLETTWLIFAANPFRRGLSVSERVARVRSDFKTAARRLDSCMAAHGETPSQPSDGAAPRPASTSQQLVERQDELEPVIRRTSSLSDSDVREDVMDFVFDVEEQTQSICGAPTGADLALLLLGRSREVAEQ